MPTSYTSLLGLALPVTGELSGTWGDTVNDYITEYLDAAVAGAQTISGSQTAVTLSTANGTSLTQAGTGATGSAQYQIINCTGNPASLLTITVPAASKVYLVINATSTSQSVKVVGTGPTTGVTIASSENALIAWNGSDFVKVASSLVDGVSTISFGTTGLTPAVATSGAVTVAGTLAVANGGTGATSQQAAINALAGATTSAQYLRGNGTNVVMSGIQAGDVPTLNQNTTGTAANVTGTVAIANGGTGATTNSGARTNLGATTVGSNFFTLTNPSAITFPSINADNTVSALDAATFRTAIGAGTGGGSVTSVSFTGGIVSVANPTTTPALTVAGSSGGIPYFSSPTGWASSGTLAPNALVVGGGAGAAPSTITTGTGVVTAIGNTANTSGGLVTQSGTLAANSLLLGGGASTAISSTTTGTGVVTALGVNTGTAGAFVVNGGALGTPSSGTVTNLTGTASININGTVGATTANTGAFTTLSASSTVTFSTTTQNLDLGTSQTSGTWTAGGASQTGALTLDQSTKTHTLNLGSGATENALTKTINFGTAGVNGSTTTINYGSAVSGSLVTHIWNCGGEKMRLSSTGYLSVSGAGSAALGVTFSATAMTLNCTQSNVFTVTLTANVTVAPTLSNPSSGQTINWFMTQDSTGSRTMTWPTSFKWPGGTAGVLSTAANSVDLLTATYRSDTGFWYATLLKAFS